MSLPLLSLTRSFTVSHSLNRDQPSSLSEDILYVQDDEEQKFFVKKRAQRMWSRIVKLINCEQLWITYENCGMNVDEQKKKNLWLSQLWLTVVCGVTG